MKFLMVYTPEKVRPPTREHIEEMGKFIEASYQSESSASPTGRSVRPRK